MPNKTMIDPLFHQMMLFKKSKAQGCLAISVYYVSCLIIMLVTT